MGSKTEDRLRERGITIGSGDSQKYLNMLASALGNTSNYTEQATCKYERDLLNRGHHWRDSIYPNQFIYVYKDARLFQIGSNSNCFIQPPAMNWPSHGSALTVHLSYWDQPIGRKTQGTQRKQKKAVVTRQRSDSKS